ncbi:MAG: hypothetical protein MI865_12840 [Proteobacteria bacterium]|nr:hypothetical protein [Pseudomonadota bacterium]
MITIVSNDAGGAEILSSWILTQDEPYNLVLSGPAVNIFQKKVGVIKCTPLESAIVDADWLLSGTSRDSNLEIDAIKLARKHKKKSVTFLDHWCNYDQRFIRDGIKTLPDEIWVGDETAFHIAKVEFPKTPILLKSNPFFDSIKKEIAFQKETQKNNLQEPYILYVCTPLNDHALEKYGDVRYWGYTEEEAIRYFINNIHAIDPSIKKIILRPHPSEEKNKYDWVIDEYRSIVTIGGDNELLEEIIGAEIIAGCNSMAMVIGLFANKRVINALPPGFRTNSLPMPEIELLQNLVDEYNASKDLS